MSENIYNLPLGLNAKAAQSALQQGQTPTNEILQQWFGNDWEKHPRADDIFETLQATRMEPTAAHKKLDSQIESLHCRPLGTIVSAGLYNHLKGQDQTTRSLTLQTLLRPFDENGSKGISEILATAGIEHPFQMKELARSAIQGAADSLQKPQIQTANNLATGPSVAL